MHPDPILIKAFNQMFLQLLKTLLLPSKPTIIIFIITLIVLAIFLFLTFGRNREPNGLSAETNRLIGSICYTISFLAITGICFKIFGIGMFEENIFYMLELDAFMLVRIILIVIGIWNY
jgi:hypothetical protein